LRKLTRKKMEDEEKVVTMRKRTNAMVLAVVTATA
jgi:hypothetical protein